MPIQYSIQKMKIEITEEIQKLIKLNKEMPLNSWIIQLERKYPTSRKEILKIIFELRDVMYPNLLIDEEHTLLDGRKVGLLTNTLTPPSK